MSSKLFQQTRNTTQLEMLDSVIIVWDIHTPQKIAPGIETLSVALKVALAIIISFYTISRAQC
jgi:hypothetical protein